MGVDSRPSPCCWRKGHTESTKKSKPSPGSTAQLEPTMQTPPTIPKKCGDHLKQPTVIEIEDEDNVEDEDEESNSADIQGTHRGSRCQAW